VQKLIQKLGGASADKPKLNAVETPPQEHFYFQFEYPKMIPESTTYF